MVGNKSGEVNRSRIAGDLEYLAKQCGLFLSGGSFLDGSGVVLVGVRLGCKLSRSVARQQCLSPGRGKEAGQSGCSAGGPDELQQPEQREALWGENDKPWQNRCGNKVKEALRV